MNNIIKNKNFKEEYSSHFNILNLSEEKYSFSKHINNQKIININNFEIKINLIKINFSIIYTNPFVLDENILNKIKFYYTRYNNQTIRIDNIFKNINNIKLIDVNFIKKIIEQKKFINTNYICLEETFLIMLYLINFDNNIHNKKYFLTKLKYYWEKYKIGNFNPFDIIDKITYLKNINKEKDNSTFINEIKFYSSFYLLIEELHIKYIMNWLKINKYSLCNFYLYKNIKFIFNSNYIKLNPQEILNNCYENNNFNIQNINELFQIPPGRNFLLLFNCNTVCYYNPDKYNLNNLVKLSYLFNISGLNLDNISNRIPIQTITNDNNCLFYCLRFAQDIINNKINLNKLKIFVLMFEKKILIKRDINLWIKQII